MITKDKAIELVRSINGMDINKKIRMGTRGDLYMHFPGFYAALIAISELNPLDHTNYTAYTGTDPIGAITQFFDDFPIEKFRVMVNDEFGNNNDAQALIALYEATSACLFSAKPTMLYKSRDNELAVKFPAKSNIVKLFQMHPELKSEVAMYKDKPTVIFIPAKIINGQLAACFKSETLRDRFVNILGLTAGMASCSTVGDNAVLLLKSNVFFQPMGNIGISTEPCLYKSAALNTFFAVREVSSKINMLSCLGKLFAKHNIFSELPLLNYMHNLPKKMKQQIALLATLLILDTAENEELAERTALTYLK